MLRDVEPHSIQIADCRENVLACRQKSEIAYQDKVLDTAAYRRQHRRTAYRLQHHIDESSCHILRLGIALSLTEERGSGIHR